MFNELICLGHGQEKPARKGVLFTKQHHLSCFRRARMTVVAGSVLLGFVVLLGLAPGSQAAVLQVTAATYGGAVTPGTPPNITGDATLTGLTTSEGTFTNLTGATANSVVTSNLLDSVGTAPANANAAATGLSANDAVNNLQSGNFQFSTGFDANT